MKIKLPKKIMGIAVGIGLIFLGSINGNKVEAAYTSYDINGKLNYYTQELIGIML